MTTLRAALVLAGMTLFAVSVYAGGGPPNPSVQDGDWNDPLTWTGGVPLSTETAEVNHDVTVTTVGSTADVIRVAPAAGVSDGRNVIDVDAQSL